jgi:hypothetical protein
MMMITIMRMHWRGQSASIPWSGLTRRVRPCRCVVDAGTLMSYVLTDLRPGAQYTFDVEAFNTSGTSGYSQVII